MTRRALQALLLLLVSSARADETCMSPYMPKITGPGGLRLRLDARRRGRRRRLRQARHHRRQPGPPDYGKVVSSRLGGRPPRGASRRLHRRPPLPLGGRARRQHASASSTSPPTRRSPKLVKTIDTFVKDTGGVVGPHTFFALPGRMLISGLSNAKDKGGKTGARRVQQRRQVRADHLAADDAPIRLRRARRSRASTACSPRRSPAGRTTCASSAS